MGDGTLATLRDIVGEFDRVASHESGADVASTIVRRDGRFEIQTSVTFRLCAANTAWLDELYVDYANDPPGLIAAFVEKHFKPTAEKTRRAAVAAATAWQAVFDG